jgi:ribonuclease R
MKLAYQSLHSKGPTEWESSNMFLGGGTLNYMEFSIATLLSHVSPDRLVAPKVLEKKLGCETTASVQQLEIALDVLEKIGIVAKEKGKYRRELPEGIIEAKLRCSSKGFCFAIQDEEGAEDIYIRETHLSNAWNGDRVLVQVIKEGTRRRSPEGAVKLILERANPAILARVKKSDAGDYRAVPLDDRLLFEVTLNANGSQDIDSSLDRLAHIQVLRHAIGQEPPIGKIERVLGTTPESASDLDIVSCKHDLKLSFSSDLLATSSLSRALPNTLAEHRIDLTHIPTIAVAEANCPLDSSLSLESSTDGTWRLGIHIADVASYIEADDKIDREAKKRCTSVYLGETIISLFPPAVEELCGFLPEQDRLAISVLLLVNAQGELVEFTIQPTKIRVDHYLSPDRVAEILAGNPGDLPQSAIEMVQTIWNNIAPTFRNQRHARGGLDLKLIQKQAPFGDEGRLGAIFMDDVTSLLSEVMVMANYAIALHLQALQIPGIYAVQHSPDLLEVNDLVKLGINLGLKFDGDTEGSVNVSDLQKLSQQFDDSPVPQVLNYLFKSMLKTSIYSSKPGAHFGLAIENGYTHAVSPLRRYPDLIVQRIIHELFTSGRDRKTSRAKEIVNLGSSTCHGQITWNVFTPTVQQEIETVIAGSLAHLNDRTKIAQEAENDLQGLQKAERMRARTGEIFQGLITGVQSYGFFVEIEDSLVEGLVHVSSLKDDWYEFRPRYACLVGRKNRVSYRLGDRVEVQVKSVDYYRQQIDLVTVASAMLEAQAQEQEPPTDIETIEQEDE